MLREKSLHKTKESLKTDVVDEAAFSSLFVYFKGKIVYFQHICTSFVFTLCRDNPPFKNSTPSPKICQLFVVVLRDSFVSKPERHGDCHLNRAFRGRLDL